MDKVSSEELFKEIDLIQSCIDRMAKNSFVIKGWALSIFVGALALLKGDVFTSPWLVISTVIIPYFAFWYLDAYFLKVEKSYRQLYEWVITNRAKGNTSNQYDLNPSRFKTKLWRTFFSETLLVFFGIPILAMLIVCIVSIIKSGDFGYVVMLS